MPARTYPHDRLLARTILKLVPAGVTPNQITIFRILCIPAVLWLLWREAYAPAIPAFLFVAFTDMLDGSLARTRDQVTHWGMLWDPVADKLLIGTVALLLLVTSDFPPEVTVLIVGLELVFLAGGWYRKRQGIVVSANWWGKFKMLSQVAGITLFVLSLSVGSRGLALASFAVFGLAAVLALGSLFKHGL